MPYQQTKQRFVVLGPQDKTQKTHKSDSVQGSRFLKKPSQQNSDYEQQSIKGPNINNNQFLNSHQKMVISEYDDTDFIPLNKYATNVIGKEQEQKSIKIKVNTEKNVTSHLTQDHKNANLLFYDFNAYKAAGETQAERAPSRNVKSRSEFRAR